MAYILIELTPLKPFFFGKETVFTNTNYAVSEYFPQPTQILGALRLYWMEQNDLMRLQKDGKYVPYEKKTQAIRLVGNAGSETFDKNDDLGYIEHLSPMFVLKKDETCFKDALFEIPSDIVKKSCQHSIAKPKQLQGIVSKHSPVLLEDYDVKEGFVEGLGGSEFWEAYMHYKGSSFVYKHDKVFESYEQVGIGLIHKQVVNSQFYTKRSYRLKESHSFGVLVDIKEMNKEDAPLQDGIISLGADGSMFKLKVHEKIPECIATHPLIVNIQNPLAKQGTKIVLLSDAKLKQSIQKEAFFQIVKQKVAFKMLKSKNLKDSSIKTTEKLLVPKGSIYYFQSDHALPTAEGAYAKMGFNHYLVLK